MSHLVNMKIADMTFQVSALYPYVARYCEPYLIEEPGEHKIEITQKLIDEERQRCIDNGDNVDAELGKASNAFLETVCVLRAIADYISMYDRILMHGSAIAINGKGYIFTALSGTGKSTHTGLLRKLHGENAVMVNDDKPFLYIKDQQIYVCGTPWMGKHRLGNNMMVPLAGIFFLRRSEENVLNTLKPAEALSGLVSQCHRPVDPVRMINTLDMIDKILSTVPLYDFGCNMDISAAELSSSVMK